VEIDGMSAEIVWVGEKAREEALRPLKRKREGAERPLR
jgi:hypothetical protein